MQKKYDVIVIGAGPFGYSCALNLANKGLSVCIIEKNTIGGTCLNRGCIPTKVLVASARKYSDISSYSKYGISIDNPKFDYSIFKKNQNTTISRLIKGLNITLKNKGVDIVRGIGSLKENNFVSVKNDEGEHVLEYKDLIIATGSRPFMPKIWQDIKNVFDCETFWNLEVLAKNILIIGGGVIGCEYASSLSHLEYNVTLIEKMDRILITEEPEISKIMHSHLTRNGVKIFTNSQVRSMKDIDDKVHVVLEDGTELENDMLVVSIGRKRNVEDLELKILGINNIEEFIETNSYKINDNIWIGGDISFGPQLAHKAYYDADRVTEDIIAGKCNADYDYSLLPMIIFTTPEISRVGLTENGARYEYKNILAVTVSFVSNGKAVVENNTRGFLKMIVDNDSKIILGITIFGHEAVELHSSSLLIIKNKMTINDVANTYFGHPTLSEIFRHAAAEYE